MIWIIPSAQKQFDCDKKLHLQINSKRITYDVKIQFKEAISEKKLSDASSQLYSSSDRENNESLKMGRRIDEIL